MTRGISIWVHFYLFFLLTVSIQQRANAQEVSDNQVNSVYFNLNFSLGIPQQQFHDRLDAVGVGIGGNVIVDLPYFPWHRQNRDVFDRQLTIIPQKPLQWKG